LPQSKNGLVTTEYIVWPRESTALGTLDRPNAGSPKE
jgi:hypothetical protein